MNIQKIPLAEFKENIDRLLTAVIAKGHNSMEPSDLGDLIGHLISCKSLKEAEDVYKGLCMGISHGIGIAHQEANTVSSVEEFISRWQQAYCLTRN